MSIPNALWRIQLTSTRNAARYDGRMRLAYIFILAFDVAAGLWSGGQLIAHINIWKAVGPEALTVGLWSICLLAWSSMGGITVLESLQQGLSDDSSHLLFTLPISPAMRFRALYGTFFIGRLWNWLLLEIGITGTALIIGLGWQQALSWLILLQLGVGCVVYIGIMGTLAFIRYVLPVRQGKRLLFIGLVCGCITAVVVYLIWQPQGVPLHFAYFQVTNINLISLLFVLMLMLALGPCAIYAGKLYEAAFLTTQQWDRSRKKMILPGVSELAHLLAYHRSFMGALFVKGLLNQGRNVMFWLRMAIILLALAFYVPVHSIVTHYIHSDTLFVASYAAALALMTILEQAPNSFAGEGNRLSLYLIAPCGMTDILRGKLMVFLLPVVSVGLCFDLVLSWRLGLAFGDIVFTAVVMVLVLIGCTALPVWGSAWDANLNLVVEGTVQMMMQEEAAITPRRQMLVNLTVLLCAASLFIVWKLSLPVALIALVLLHGLVLVGMWRMGKIWLRHLLRVG